jgi:ankyrin repeat protein
MTDLHRAAAKGDCEWIRWEVKRGESLAAKDRNGATPLHWAALAGQAAASRLLIELGANLRDLDHEGLTPREYAEMSEEYLSEDEVHELLKLFGQLRKGPPARKDRTP